MNGYFLCDKPAAERTRHKYDSHGQILALAGAIISMKVVKIV